MHKGENEWDFYFQTVTLKRSGHTKESLSIHLKENEHLKRQTPNLECAHITNNVIECWYGHKCSHIFCCERVFSSQPDCLALTNCTGFQINFTPDYFETLLPHEPNRTGSPSVNAQRTRMHVRKVCLGEITHICAYRQPKWNMFLVCVLIATLFTFDQNSSMNDEVKCGHTWCKRQLHHPPSSASQPGSEVWASYLHLFPLLHSHCPPSFSAHTHPAPKDTNLFQFSLKPDLMNLIQFLIWWTRFYS